MNNNISYFRSYESKERELDELEGLIQLYSDKQDFYIALSLAFSVHCYDFGYSNYQHFVANKLTPLSEIQKRYFRKYSAPDEGEITEFLFDVNRIIVALKEIKNMNPSSVAVLNETLVILKKYSSDLRFVKNCNKDYLEIKKEFSLKDPDKEKH